MSQISFELVPNNLRVPGAYAEINNDFAIQGLVGQPYTALIAGQMFSTGTATAGQQVQVTSPEQAAVLFGEGSMIHRMVSRYKDNDEFTKTICIPVLDDAAGSAAERPLTVTASSVQAGTIYLYIAGELVKVGVSQGDSASVIASAIAAEIEAQKLPLGASVSSDVVTLTAKHKGENGKSIDVRVNYYADQSLPSGVSIDIGAVSGGTGNPDITDVIAAMADTWFNVLVMPWTDSANMAALAVELSDRFGPMVAMDGVAFCAYRGNHSQLTTFGQGGNSAHISVLESNGYPINPEERAAMYAAQVGFSAQNDPARPFQTLPLKGDLPPSVNERFTLSERNLLLFDGVSICKTDAGGVVRIERSITMYTENEAGAPDPSYLDVNTLYTLSYLRYSWRARVLQKYPRFKLGKDGSRGDKVMTPKLMKSEMVALAGDWADQGLIESVEQFKNDLHVSIDANDPNRLNMILPPDLMNQLRIIASRIDFRL